MLFIYPAAFLPLQSKCLIHFYINACEVWAFVYRMDVASPLWPLPPLPPPFSFPDWVDPIERFWGVGASGRFCIQLERPLWPADGGEDGLLWVFLSSGSYLGYRKGRTDSNKNGPCWTPTMSGYIRLHVCIFDSKMLKVLFYFTTVSTQPTEKMWMEILKKGMSNFHWPETGFLAFIKQFLEAGLPLQYWFFCYRNAHAADVVGGLVQVAHVGDAIFLPAGADGACSLWENCLDPTRRLEMIGFIDRPVPWLSGRLSERGATLLSGLHCSLLPETLHWYEFDMTVKCQLCTYVQGPAPFQLRARRRDKRGERDRKEDKATGYLEVCACGSQKIIYPEYRELFPGHLVVNKEPPAKLWWGDKDPTRMRSFFPASLSPRVCISIRFGLLSARNNKKTETNLGAGYAVNKVIIRFHLNRILLKN